MSRATAETLKLNAVTECSMNNTRELLPDLGHDFSGICSSLTSHPVFDGSM